MGLESGRVGVWGRGGRVNNTKSLSNVKECTARTLYCCILGEMQQRLNREYINKARNWFGKS